MIEALIKYGNVLEQMAKKLLLVCPYYRPTIKTLVKVQSKGKETKILSQSQYNKIVIILSFCLKKEMQVSIVLKKLNCHIVHRMISQPQFKRILQRLNICLGKLI